MPRKRVGNVTESLEELRALEEHYRGKPEQVRVTVLRLFKEDPERGIEDAALLVGYSVPTVKRWWRTYREGGMDALMGFAGGIRPTPVDEDLNILKQKILTGEFSSVEEVYAWIGSQVNMHQGKRSGRRTAAAKNVGHHSNGFYPDSNGAVQSKLVQDLTSGLAERLFKFISSLPNTHTIKEWSDSFRSALQTFLGDVDRVSISVNVRCDLLNPQAYQPDIVISQDVTTNVKAVKPIVESRSANKNESIHLERLLDNLRGTKFPFGVYQQPVCYVYYYLDYAYLGVIMLWRERSKPPISESTLALMDRLNSFLGYVLSDSVARYQAANPVEHVFDKALEGVTIETGLTMQERRIMVLQLLGLSYDEVAMSLSISLNTVRYHLRSIYQKTGTHSLAELFAKYFTPRIDPDQASE